ncbi:hypothetical protein [Pseudoxanthomonas sp. 10H]|uniref:hypothetical protein n=1 Tax=Pseudoxanthomonas sp. 10H TaxID=3242729 RepID=UPI003558D32D
MGPRAEFTLSAALAGTAVAVLGYLVASAFVFDQPLGEALRNGAQWSPTGTLAAAGAAWIAIAWHRRAAVAGRRWGAAGMALRATSLVLLLYPAAVAFWVMATGLLDRHVASGGMPLRELAAWVPSIVVGATLAAVLVGALPAFAIAFLLCRRYLQRAAGSTTDIA